MTDGSGAGRRRIHVEGASSWADGRPRNPFAPPPDVTRPSAPTAPGPAAPSLTEAEHRDALDRSEADVRRRVASIKGRIAAAQDAVKAMVPETVALNATAVKDALASATGRRHAAADSARLQYEREASSLLDDLVARADALAPGWASAPFTPEWSAPETVIPADHVRIGAATPDGLPLLAPLVNHPGLTVTGDTRAAHDLVRTITLRLLAQSPLKHVVVDVFDPKLRGILSDVSGLRAAHPASIPTPALDASSFAQRLDDALRDAARNVELIQSGGFGTLTDLWRRQQVPEGVLRLVVLLDYPYAVDRDLQGRLLRLASVAGTSGVSLLVAHDPAVVAEGELNPTDLLGRLRGIDIARDHVHLSGHPLPGQPDGTIPVSFVQAMVAGLAEASRSAQGPTIGLAEVLAADFETPWLGEGRPRESTESLDVVFGRTGRDPLSLSLRTENPPHPNLLVGGAVGQGKSNLLLDLIYGLAARYAPTELEFHLLDFKRGLEFKRFAPDIDGRNWLPHVRTLSLESNQSFGVAVLRHVEAEMERRSQLFKGVDANSLNAYRTITGAAVPRLVLVIDEFHMLFEGDDHLVDAAVELMSKLAKQGRAYGIHLLLASQTTSGVRGLAVKGDSIFAQFPLRLSLKNTPQESQAILSEGNKAAADLTYRGEVILNRNFGADPEGSNVRGLVAFAEPDSLRALQERLWRLDHGAPPMLFVGGDFAGWEPANRLPSPRAGVLELLLGRPMAVTDAPTCLMLERDADQAVAVVGTDARLALAALNASVRSAIPQLAAVGGSLVLLDGLADEHTAWVDALADAAARAGVATVRASRYEAASTLVDIVGPRLDVDEAPMLVAGLGMQRARDMEQTHTATSSSSDNPFDIVVPDFSFGPGSEVSGRSILQKLARSGGVVGVQLIGWWSTLRTLEADLGMTHAGVGTFVTAGLGRDDLRAVAGVTAQPPDGWPRVGLLDRNGEGGLRSVVPFDPAVTFEDGIDVR